MAVKALLYIARWDLRCGFSHLPVANLRTEVGHVIWQEQQLKGGDVGPLGCHLYRNNGDGRWRMPLGILFGL